MNLRATLGARALSFLGAALGLCLQAACAQPAPPAPPPGADPQGPQGPRGPHGPHPLEGYWEGEGGSGKVSMTFAGDSLYFHQRADFQYDTVFELVPGTDPPELRATILDSPRTTDSAGEVVVAIYALEDGALTIAAVDKVEGEPASFDDALSRYRLERVEPPG